MMNGHLVVALVVIDRVQQFVRFVSAGLAQEILVKF